MILTLNAGSSSLKFALFADDANGAPYVRGSVEVDAGHALGRVLETLGPHADAIRAVGHRIVHGGLRFVAPAVLGDDALAALEALVPLAPLHQPANLAGVRAARRAFAGALQIGCFDTAFHRTIAWPHDAYALPRRFYDAGVRRYGFHGISYEYVAGAVAARLPAARRVVVAHLGAGASLAALRDGRSVACSMGFSVLDGVPMATRCGALDPALPLYLQRHCGLDPDALEDLLYRGCGLLVVSGLSGDVRMLEASDDDAARRAIALFVAGVRRELGALVAALGGLDALVFTAGIGENSARVRAAVCADMDWLGIRLDAERNASGAECIAAGDSRVAVLVIPTDEERQIARAVAALLD